MWWGRSIYVGDLGQYYIGLNNWSETGAQLAAAITLVERLGATVVGAACLHIGPQARQEPRLSRYRLHDLIQYEAA